MPGTAWSNSTKHSVNDIRGRVADAIEVLVHDGYIEDSENGHRFPSKLLRDWFAARFRDHHLPLEGRCREQVSGDQTS